MLTGRNWRDYRARTITVSMSLARLRVRGGFHGADQIQELVATPTPPLPRMEVAGMLTHPAPPMGAPAEVGFPHSHSPPAEAELAATQRRQPLPRLQVTTLQLHQVTLVRVPVVPVLSVTARPLTGLPVRPTQHQAQRQLERATPPHKLWSIVAQALAPLWRQARRMRALIEACRHPLPLL